MKHRPLEMGDLKGAIVDDEGKFVYVHIEVK